MAVHTHACYPHYEAGGTTPPKEQIPDCSDTAVTSALKAPWDPNHSVMF